MQAGSLDPSPVSVRRRGAQTCAHREDRGRAEAGAPTHLRARGRRPPPGLERAGPPSASASASRGGSGLLTLRKHPTQAALRSGFRPESLRSHHQPQPQPRPQPQPQPQPYLPGSRDPRGARGLTAAHGPEPEESERGISPTRHRGLHTRSPLDLGAGGAGRSSGAPLRAVLSAWPPPAARPILRRTGRSTCPRQSRLPRASQL